MAVSHVGTEPIPGACNWVVASIGGFTPAGVPTTTRYYCYAPGDHPGLTPRSATVWLCRPHCEQLIRDGILRPRPQETTMRPPHPLMRLFELDHLPENLQTVSAPFRRLAHDTSQTWADWDDPLLQEFMLALFQAKNLAVLAVARPAV